MRGRHHRQRRGYLDGRALAEVFAWLRPGDLVWNYWVNNYLLGQRPPAFDVLFWNADTTRMSARLHADFVDLAMDNKLVTPGALTVLGTPVDRHRLNRGGDRNANSALWRIALVRMHCHQPTKDYVARRTAEGLSKTEILRCLKRYVARETYPCPLAMAAAGTSRHTPRPLALTPRRRTT